MQMIEFSQQAVTGDSKETGLALLLLFVFALIAAGYVLKEGLRKKEKTTHEILLKCVIIITSVVPRQFPMQMAVAVNMALMALSKVILIALLLLLLILLLILIKGWYLLHRAVSCTVSRQDLSLSL